MKNVTFRWLIVTIVSIFVISGCYTKKRAIEKFCKQDSATATILVHDTVIVQRILADTVFSASIDSVVVSKDRLVITYKKVFDKVYLTGECKGDTIYRVKEVTVTIPCNCPPPIEPSIWDNWQYLLYGCLIGIILFATLLWRK